MLSDKVIAVCGMNNIGSAKSLLCDQELRRIWSWVIKRNTFITAAHIPGILNVEVMINRTKVDQESRNQKKK